MQVNEYQVKGGNANAPFTLKVHRGDGMALLAMNWKDGEPPDSFVGFGIGYSYPNSDTIRWISNRLSFEEDMSSLNLQDPPKFFKSIDAPIQKFRWTHFPWNPNKEGLYTYKVVPIFMNEYGDLSEGEPQVVKIRLSRETIPGKVNVCFTRGFVSSQAFADKYSENGSINTLLPPKHDEGLDFIPTHEKAEEALNWMGFEAREEILSILNLANIENADVYINAYELSISHVLEPLEVLGDRLRIIIDDSAKHGKTSSAETKSANRLALNGSNVIRQHMKKLQHNKTIVVDGEGTQKVICGSTNFSWRGFYVQANHAVTLTGESAVNIYKEAFENYINFGKNFSKSPSALWQRIEMDDVDIQVSFSPHNKSNAILKTIADDIATAKSSVFYSLAFLNLFGVNNIVKKSIKKVTQSENTFVYGISDRRTIFGDGKILVQKPDGNIRPVFVKPLKKSLPEPFRSEAAGGGGNRMHHKFVVIDFDTDDARVYFGSYNFSDAADKSNGENLTLIRDRRVATSFMIEALRLFDHYHFRVSVAEFSKTRKKLQLKKPPSLSGEVPWWKEDYINPQKIKDRELFS